MTETPTELTLTLDGEQVHAKDGETLLDVCRRAGKEVPTLCAEDRVDPMGSCRMCLCLLYTSPSPRDRG